MKRSSPGMTLIEVMMALSVLTVAIMSLLTLIPTTNRLIDDSNENEIARQAAEMMIDEIRAAGPGSAASYDETTFPDPQNALKPLEGNTDCGQVTVLPAGTTLDDGTTVPVGTSMILVSVAWTGSDKVDKEIVIETLVSE